MDSPVAVEAPNVVVTGVQDCLDGGIREDFAERAHVADGEGVNQIHAFRSEQLYETDAFRVPKEAV